MQLLCLFYRMILNKKSNGNSKDKFVSRVKVVLKRYKTYLSSKLNHPTCSIPRQNILLGQNGAWDRNGLDVFVPFLFMDMIILTKATVFLPTFFTYDFHVFLLEIGFYRACHTIDDTRSHSRLLPGHICT